MRALSVVGAALALCLGAPALGAVTQRGEERQPRNIYELIYAFEHTFNNVLKGDELALFR
jgi:hypothetical protein